MIYDLTNELHRKSFQARVDYLLEKGVSVELTEKMFRTPNQNRYLHLLLGVVAIDRFKRWGYENGIYMPNPEDTALLKQIEIDMGRMQNYL